MSNQYEVQRLLDQLDRVDNVTRDLNELADRSRLEGRWNEAHKYCEESLNLARAFNDPRSEGICLLHGWAVHVLKGDFEKAIDFCHRSRQAFDRVVDSYGQVLAMFSLGITYQEWEADNRDPTKLREALRIYGQALEEVCELKERFDFSGNVEKAKVCQRLIIEMRERFHHVATLYARREEERKEEKRPAPPEELRTRIISFPTLQFIPIVGQIAAGRPVPTDDDIEGYVATSRVNIDDSEYTVRVLGEGKGNILVFDLESRYFATPVKGDSMNEAGISNGDYIIIRQPRGSHPSPDPQDIVAAVIKDEDREATLKRFRQRGQKIILSPESSNPDHQPREFDPSEWSEKVEIAGIAVAVLKKVQESPDSPERHPG